MPNSIVVRSSGLENDPQSSIDTVVLEDVRKTEPVVLMWRSANIFTSGTVDSPADFSDKPNRRSLSLSWGRASVNIFDLESLKEVIK